MRMSRLLAPTLREDPAEAEVISHKLLTRAGYIRKLASGIYNYLPLMQRVIQKVEAIVRDELDKAGAQEMLMPILQPADIWQESGRWWVYGKELVRLKDRHERDCVLGPTHEEVITTLARNELNSYRQLPVNLYQIQNKYRDEVRPRFGLLRGREFIMKDAYSFHANDACLDKEYGVMAEAYTRIFKRCGLETKMVRSDSGAIGGSVSHEFMVLTTQLEGEQQSGENDVFFCDGCGYSANGNHAETKLSPSSEKSSYSQTEVVETPGATSIEIMHKKFKMHPELILKSLIYMADGENPVMVLIRGDRDVEEIKLKNVVGANELWMATPEELRELSGGSAKGFIGPVGLPDKVRIIADESARPMKDFFVAVNEVDKHLVNGNWGSDVPMPTEFADVLMARVGDACPECSQPMQMTRGIEVGNIFKLGTKYSESMSAKFTDEDGTEKHFIMGCYGIGITRTAASAIEQFHDKWGIIWPMGIAPYQVVVVPVNVQDETQWKLANDIYEQLQAAGVEVVLDDRDERAGVKFKDADLIGFPIRVTAGKKAGEGLLEVKMRDADSPVDLPQADILPFVQTQITNWQPSLKQPASVS